MRRVSGRLLPPLRWHGFAAALWLGGLMAWAPLPAQAQTTDPSATYQVTFEGTWTTAATPGGVPGSAHFTTLIGATHNDSVTFWEAGGTATPGIESVAEIGGTSTFKSEINASAHADTLIELGVGGGATPNASVNFDANKTHPLVTLITMIAPSPDWFVGVSGCSWQL